MMLKLKDLWKGIALNKQQFQDILHQIFPEIAIIHYRRFSKEGNQLIEGAMNSLFNAFDSDGT